MVVAEFRDPLPWLIRATAPTLESHFHICFPSSTLGTGHCFWGRECPKLERLSLTERGAFSYLPTPSRHQLIVGWIVNAWLARLG
jgi:hypothetical protein